MIKHKIKQDENGQAFSTVGRRLSPKFKNWVAPTYVIDSLYRVRVKLLTAKQANSDQGKFLKQKINL